MQCAPEDDEALGNATTHRLPFSPLDSPLSPPERRSASILSSKTKSSPRRKTIIPRHRTKTSVSCWTRSGRSMKHSIDGRSIADGKMRTQKSEIEERPSGRPDGTKRLCGYSSLINEDGQTQLHLLCQKSSCSMEEVKDLIIAVPSALSKRDVYGRSVSRITLGKAKFVTFHACVSYLSLIVPFQPLFYALKRGCSIEVIQLLFDGFPDAILFKDFCGDIPLYLLYHPSKDSHILQYVLKKMPSLAVYK